MPKGAKNDTLDWQQGIPEQMVISVQMENAAGNFLFLVS